MRALLPRLPRPFPRTAAGLAFSLAGILAIAPASAQLTLEPVVSGLTRPLTVRHAGDGSGRLFVVEQAGRIRVIENGVLLPTPFLDIEALVDDTRGEQGLLGLDFHPDYASNGYFYVNYTRDPPLGLDRTRVARYTVSADPNVADAGSAVVVLEIEQDFDNHNGGDLHFGPDGYLYIGMGDGGSGGDPNERAQDLGELLGKMLRIDVDGSPPSQPNDLCGLITNYGIPPGNPYAGGSGDCDEIWAVGLRNPFRFSFDRQTGDLFIGDVGQLSVEEISFQAAGAGGLNFGWDCYEGSSEYELTDCDGTYTPPILEYTHSSGTACGNPPGFVCAVIGGYRYRGGVLAELQGAYLYGDNCSREICVAREDGGWTAIDSGLSAPGDVFSFGEDEAGELYLAAGSGIYRIADPVALRAEDFESGSFTPWSDVHPPP